MTAPLMPVSYVFTPEESGGTATRGPGQVYIGLPSGVSTVVLTWWGSTYCRLRSQPTGYGGVDRTLINLPDVSSAGHRQRVIQVATNHPDARIYVQTGPGESTYHVGVTLIPIPLA